MFTVYLCSVQSSSIIVYFPTAGLLDQAHEQLKDAAYLFGRVCDDLHPEACYCHSLLARVAFLQGKTAEVGLLLHMTPQLCYW